MLPSALQGVMAEVIVDDRLSLQERRYVKAADSLSAFLKASVELANGNQEYRYTVSDLAERLDAYDLPEVGYFLAHFSGLDDSSEWAAGRSGEKGVQLRVMARSWRSDVA